MGDNMNYLISFVFSKTENEMYIKMYMSFYSENSLLLLYVTRIKKNENLTAHQSFRLLYQCQSKIFLHS